MGLFRRLFNRVRKFAHTTFGVMLGIAISGFSMAATYLAVRGIELAMTTAVAVQQAVDNIIWGGRLVARAVWTFPGIIPWVIP